MRAAGHSRFLAALGMTGACSEYFMRFATLTTWNENVHGAETGNHKGCPYDRYVGVYFCGNDRLLRELREGLKSREFGVSRHGFPPSRE